MEATLLDQNIVVRCSLVVIGSRLRRAHQQQHTPIYLPPGLCPLVLQNVVATHVIPRLPDVTQIPDGSWEGWGLVLEQLAVDPANQQAVDTTIARCQAMLNSLLQAALEGAQAMEGAQAAPVLQEQVCVRASVSKISTPVDLKVANMVSQCVCLCYINVIMN